MIFFNAFTIISYCSYLVIFYFFLVFGFVRAASSAANNCRPLFFCSSLYLLHCVLWSGFLRYLFAVYSISIRRTMKRAVALVIWLVFPWANRSVSAGVYGQPFFGLVPDFPRTLDTLKSRVVSMSPFSLNTLSLPVSSACTSSA